MKQEQLGFDIVKTRVAAMADKLRAEDRSAPPRSSTSTSNFDRRRAEPEGEPAPETEDLCGACGKVARRYSAFRDGKVWRLVCKPCHDAAARPLGPVPCSGCNVPARVVTMRNGRVCCASCRVRP